jgi:hypothetical protein
MTLEERRAWSRMLVSVAAYAVYVTIIVNRADGGPLADVPYAATLLWTIGIAIAASIAFEIVIAITGEVVASVKESVQKEIGLASGKRRRGRLEVDERDREIGRYGEYVGNSFVVIGATSAMLMAMVEWPWFWIANVIYLCFLLSQVLSSITKIVLYRRGLPQW